MRLLKCFLLFLIINHLLQVSTGDGLPETICEPCARLLDKFFLFRKMCWEVDGKLKLYLISDNDGNVSMFYSFGIVLHHILYLRSYVLIDTL